MGESLNSYLNFEDYESSYQEDLPRGLLNFGSPNIQIKKKKKKKIPRHCVF